MRQIWKSALTMALASVIGCQAFYNPLVDFPITASGKTRSPLFRLYSNTRYLIFIGLDPMQVDEATCAAAYVAQAVPVPSPCIQVRPPFGPIHWVVTQDGKEIARGSLPGEPGDIPKDRQNSWAKDKAMTWGSYPGWYGHPGKDYAMEVEIQPASVDLAPLHPRLAIVEPL